MFDQLFDLFPLQELLDWKALTYIILGAVLLTIFKSINCLFSGYDLNIELTQKDNKAIAVSFSGFILAILIVIYGILSSSSGFDSTWTNDLLSTTIWSVIGCIYLLSARIVNDKLILPKFSNTKELAEDRNIGVGAVQAGSYIATALIIKATLTGPDALSLGQEITLTLIWFVITQALLIGFTYAYQMITKYDLHEELRNDNAAAGVALGGNLIAFSLLLAFYIGSYDSILGLIIWSIISIILLFAVRIIVDKTLLPKQNLDKEIANDHNWGAGTIEAVTAIGAALIISGSFS